MMLVLETQIHENYGNLDNPYWKAKGGETYKITNVPADYNIELIQDYMENVHFINNDWSTEYLVESHTEEDDYITTFENDQLEYEGMIRYITPVIDYSAILIVSTI
jgi:hypothetical protein